MYQTFLGTKKLSAPEHLPDFDFDDEHPYAPEDQPFIGGSTTIRQVRLNFDEDPMSPINQAGISAMIDQAQANPSAFVVDSAGPVALCSRASLERRFTTKFVYLQKVKRGTTGQQTTTPAGGELSPAARTNRAKGVSTSATSQKGKSSLPSLYRSWRCVTVSALRGTWKIGCASPSTTPPSRRR